LDLPNTTDEEKVLRGNNLAEVPHSRTDRSRIPSIRTAPRDGLSPCYHVPLEFKNSRFVVNLPEQCEDILSR
jgi:hypothetical protein